PTSDSLTVSPGPTPPVTSTTGARPRWYRAAAWSSRARNTGEGRPLYWAAPRTAMASAVVAWSCAPASATATTTAAQPKASSRTTTPAAASLRRRVQKGMRRIYERRCRGWWRVGRLVEVGGSPPTLPNLHNLHQPSPSFGEDLLKQRDRPRVVRLAQPEQRLLAHTRTGVGAGDADQDRH